MRKDDIMTLTREKDACPSDKFSRRKFFGLASDGRGRGGPVPSPDLPGEGPERKAAGRSPGRDQDQHRRGPRHPQGRDLAPREIPRQGGQSQDRGQPRRAEDRRGPGPPRDRGRHGRAHRGKGHGQGLGEVRRSQGRRRHQGQPHRGEDPLDQARGRGRRHRRAPGRRGAEREHRHLGPAPLPAPGGRVHAGALPRHPHHGHGDEGPERRNSTTTRASSGPRTTSTARPCPTSPRSSRSTTRSSWATCSTRARAPISRRSSRRR